jgi:MSHA biogenesis protein MshO
VDQVLGQSRFAMERMTRELRSAVPNSVRLSGNNTNWQCIEFVPAQTSTSYVSMPIAPSAGANSGSVIIDRRGNSQISSGQLAIIYPLSDANVYDATQNKRYLITSVSAVGDEVTLGFGTNILFAEASPRKRVYFASQAVSYCFEQLGAGLPGEVYRYSGYGLLLIQPNPGTMPNSRIRSLMAQGVDNNLADSNDLPLFLTPSSLVTNAIVQLQPRFSVLGETFQYRHQVQVINVP